MASLNGRKFFRGIKNWFRNTIFAISDFSIISLCHCQLLVTDWPEMLQKAQKLFFFLAFCIMFWIINSDLGLLNIFQCGFQCISICISLHTSNMVWFLSWVAKYLKMGNWLCCACLHSQWYLQNMIILFLFYDCYKLADLVFILFDHEPFFC